MAKGGKHLKQSVGKGTTDENTAGRPKAVKKSKVRLKKGPLLAVVLILVLSFAVVSPLRGCTLTGDGLIGEDKAVSLCVSEAAVGKCDSSRAELTKIDGKFCYKVEFSSDGVQYKYIIDGENGGIIARKAVK